MKMLSQISQLVFIQITILIYQISLNPLKMANVQYAILDVGQTKGAKRNRVFI